MKSIYYWLLTGFFLVFTMVIVGGITRLTHSGLSIVEWNVIMGTIPPLDDNQWQELFEKYKQFPEYKELNYRFTLSDFKTIFWWEYIHRLIGRIIGVVFIIPFVWFLIRKKIPKPLFQHLIFIFLMGAFQGLLGWLMVESGLVDIPRVSHYRLAAHLLSATVLIGYILWVALLVKAPSLKSQIQSSKRNFLGTLPAGRQVWDLEFGTLDFPQFRHLRRIAVITLFITAMQLTYGAFVAGLRAGFFYNTFPMMGDEWIASAVFYGWEQMGFWSLFENPATVQFIHRWLAFVVLFFASYIFIKTRKTGGLKQAGTILLALVLLQMGLGILTLLFSVPLWIAVAHQAVAVMVVASVIYLIHQIANAHAGHEQN